MALNEQIAACLGESAARYAANKHRGGSNGNKGVRYEDFFIAFHAVDGLLQHVLDLSAPPIHFKGQAEGFADDVRIASAASIAYFQLKNAQSVQWSAAPHPIETDFDYQARLSAHLGETSVSTTLVVPSITLSESLRLNIPNKIRAHTKVEHFPWTETANRLVLECAELREQLTQIVNVDDPTDDVLVGAFGMILIACLNYPGGADARELLAHCSKLYPNQLRLANMDEAWEQHLKSDFTAILDKIPGFSYGAKRGFFYWSASGTSGVFGSSVLSEEFNLFQRDVVQRNPKTLDDFEEVLP